MKAISVKQPWANMIAVGDKTIEVRTWSTKHRGPLLIVASRKPHIPPAGAAVAVAQLTACRPMEPDDTAAACCPFQPGAYAWVLADIRPVEPFNVLGRLGLYEVAVRPAASDALDDHCNAHPAADAERSEADSTIPALHFVEQRD